MRNLHNQNGMYKDTRSKHVVLFVLPAKYGYEGILNNIYQRSRNCWRVHVNQPRFSEYLCSSELSSCTSDSPNQAQWLHACQTGRSGNQPMLKTLPCQSGDFEVCQIRPSAMFFTQRKMAEQVKERAVNATLINASNNEKYKLRVKRSADLVRCTVKCKRLRLLLAMTELSV